MNKKCVYILYIYVCVWIYCKCLLYTYTIRIKTVYTSTVFGDGLLKTKNDDVCNKCDMNVHEPLPLKFAQCHKIMKPWNPCAPDEEAKSAGGASKRHECSQLVTESWPPPAAEWSDASSFQSPPPAEEFQGSDWTPQNSSGPQLQLLQWGSMASLQVTSGVLMILEGSLEVKLLTIWTDGKAEVRRVQEEKKRSEKIREEKEREERRCRCTKR